jgi:hypothetical protein
MKTIQKIALFSLVAFQFSVYSGMPGVGSEAPKQLRVRNAAKVPVTVDIGYSKNPDVGFKGIYVGPSSAKPVPALFEFFWFEKTGTGYGTETKARDVLKHAYPDTVTFNIPDFGEVKASLAPKQSSYNVTLEQKGPEKYEATVGELPIPKTEQLVRIQPVGIPGTHPTPKQPTHPTPKQPTAQQQLINIQTLPRK